MAYDVSHILSLGQIKSILQKISSELNSKYTKPTDGIPASDLASGVIPDAVLKSGSTMTGALTLSGAPTSNLHAATKKYVDDGLSGKQATLTFDTTPTASSTNPVTSGGVKTYVDYSYTIAGKKANTTLGTKATAEGKENTASGDYSHAEGYATTASGNHSHAEGAGTTASAYGAHAEGSETTASAYGAHAEGTSTTASSNHSHAEGYHSVASGNESHAEGEYTTANSRSLHVFGRYNSQDPTGDANNYGTYVEIVGNGSLNTSSNARTLDWSGNEVLAGKLTVGAAPTENMDVATKQYVDSSASVMTGATSSADGTKGLVPAPVTGKQNNTLRGDGAWAGNAIYPVIGTQTASTNAWKGVIDVPALYDGLTIAYYLPYAGTSTAATLNLTLSDGTTTGAKAVYYSATTRATTHYGAGSVIILTFFKAGSIKVSGTATTEDRWLRCDYDSNTKTTAGSSNSTSKLYLIGGTSQSSSGVTTYSNSAVYATNGVLTANQITLNTDPSAATDGATKQYVDTAVSEKYAKPSGGIPSSDMSSAVQTSLGKADTAYQKPSTGIPASDLASGVIPSVPSATSTSPKMDGTAAVGSETTWAKGDHVHPTDTSRAPKDHSSTDTTYGKGSDTKYGHVKLSDSTSTTSGVSGGIAATPTAVKAAYDLANGKYSKPSGGIPASDLASGVIPSVPSAYTSNPSMDGTASPGGSSTTAYAKGDHVHPTDTSRAPTDHSSTATTYGMGTDSKYGHLKLSASTSSTSGVSDGIAATPSAVKSAYDLASGALPKSGGTMTGALTLSGAPTNNLHASTKQYVDGKITYGTSDLTPGSSSLTTGTIYCVYE